MVAVGIPQNGDSSGPSCTALAVGRCKCFTSMILMQERSWFLLESVEAGQGVNGLNVVKFLADLARLLLP